MKHKFFTLITTLVFAVAFSVFAYAGSTAASAVVTIDYPGLCTLNAANPTLTYANSDVSTLANVTVNCSKGISWALTVNGGDRYSAMTGTRRAYGTNPSTGSDTIQYRLFSDVSHTQEIAPGDTVSSQWGSGVDQIVPVYYAVKLADNPNQTANISYTDTLGWLVSF